MPDQYEIDLNNAMKEVLQTVNFLKGSVKDLSGQLKDLGTSGASDVKDANKSMSDYAETVQNKGVKSVKEFRKEQRDQNFIVRESRQALMAVTMAIGFLTQGNDKAKESTKQFSTGLLTGIAAMEASEFAMFSLGRAGASMGGSVGNALSKFSQYGGIVSAFIGIGAGLVAFFDAANASAKRATEEGFKAWVELFAKLNPSAQLLSIERIHAEIYKINSQAKPVQDVAPRKMFNPATGKEEMVIPKQLSSEQQKELDFYNRLLAEAVKTKKEEELRNKVLKDGRQILEAGAKSEYDHNKFRLDQIKKELEMVGLSDSERQKKINEQYALTERQKQLEMSTEQQEEQWQKNREEGDRAILKINEDTMKVLEEHVQEYENLYKTGQMSFATMIQEMNAEADLVKGSDEELKIRAKIVDLTKQHKDEEKRLADQIARDEREYLNGLMQGLSELDRGLAATGVRSDSLVSKFIQMIQYAVQIAETMSAINAGKQSTAGGGLGIIGDILSIFALFDQGGYTGSGGRYEPAGIVHKKEYVFSAPAVERIGVSTLDQLHKQYAGYAGGGYVNSPSMGSLMPTVIVHLHNPITWGDGLKKAMPGYNKWDSQKRI